MFFLKDLPNTDVLESFKSRFPQMDIENVQVCLLILKTASEILRELEKHFAAYELSQARFLCLILLEREPDKQLLPVELSNKMGISKPNVTRLLVLLEVSGLITRCEHDTDRRASVVEITQKGTDLLASTMPRYYEIMNEATARLDSSSKQQLLSLLDQFSISFSNSAAAFP